MPVSWLLRVLGKIKQVCGLQTHVLQAKPTPQVLHWYAIGVLHQPGSRQKDKAPIISAEVNQGWEVKLLKKTLKNSKGRQGMLR